MREYIWQSYDKGHFIPQHLLKLLGTAILNVFDVCQVALKFWRRIFRLIAVTKYTVGFPTAGAKFFQKPEKSRTHDRRALHIYPTAGGEVSQKSKTHR